MSDLAPAQIEVLQRALRGKYGQGELSQGQLADLERHTTGRLNEFRELLIPWLSKNAGLASANVLEIGAGTGASTVAMAEHGARVHGIDIDAESLRVAELRCSLHGEKRTSFEVLNATEIGKFDDGFDLVIFFATLEHMTHAERLSALRNAWSMLPSGGFLGVVECPNRLWHYDNHTTLLNFFHWLPDDLAIDYARFVPRAEFRDAMTETADRTELATGLARWGRGASYHEIELAAGPIAELVVLEGMDDFRRRADPVLDDYWRHSADGRYRDALMAVAPHVPSAFFYPWMNILIRK
ncbi:class I SAM-dependent methyltransferase [Arvimicrobium flavum]|uniref:class I SAM-dependent methyltransferase n=1 Tax=Arvimicrobium flavum TaxID=3393320 RepID=UPI00237B926E|nr:class I SAM-dependent methyltransferase [Mesorhizobium shangrilense]